MKIIEYNDLDDFAKKLNEATKLDAISIDPKQWEEDKNLQQWVPYINGHKIFVFTFVKKELFNLLGCWLPHTPPLNVGEKIVCGVLHI